ncbi:methylated-DNA--[protein]-cysteine S-methyltransferase [Alkalimonas collagenimarina]|uniref:Methylated-DNA--protein-cysteine methyltransferase n=1 Tax=Alkalimonas collagenimarina TaxID=400390 RepID=A0ABT9H191_9GAMM|nr:methylated-DNA--[protein]-cysteine S-methyltransferase [Alkalimonas collagenimarina]MDP4537071.1 methylated-DNA--[protein]-cysteine S-methyltransferase [Alkalimonas collagenimarina]
MHECMITSPVGPIQLVAEHEHIIAVRFVAADELAKDQYPTRSQPYQAPITGVLKQAYEQLHSYFAGELSHFELPLAPQGTHFQQQVWQQLQRIPYGETCSYQAVANRINNPKAVRAVGMANSRNPIAIVIPCHRVIGANGHLTGYAGGLDKKTWLLNHEGW